nr:DEAD-box ATP-dependent RNA helicase 40-like [Arachis hypogaea]
MKEETPPRCHRRSFVAAAVDRRKSEIRESCEGRASPEESLPPPPPLFIAPSPLARAIASRERETRAMRELPPWRSRRVSAVGNASAAQDSLSSPEKVLPLSAVAACCSELLHCCCRRSGH